jgi:hypothetical protein
MMMAMAMVARAMATATRVRASNNEGDGGGNNCAGNEGGKQSGGWGRQGDGDGEKVGRQAMATATKRAVAMVMRVVGEDAGNGEGGKSDGDGAKRAIVRRRAMAGPIYKIK